MFLLCSQEKVFAQIPVMLDMENIILFTLIFKWILICATVLSCSTLLWKILKRKTLHTIFNLGMCFFFFITGSIFPFLINEYISLLNETIIHPDIPSPERCHKLFLYRMLIGQGFKVFLLNLIYRYIWHAAK